MSIQPGISNLRAIGTKANVTILAPADAKPEEIAYTLLDLADLLLSPTNKSPDTRRERINDLLDQVIEDEEGRKDRLYG